MNGSEEKGKKIDDLQDNLLGENKVSKKIKIIIAILIIVIFLLIALSIFIYIYFNNKLKDEIDKRDGHKKDEDEDKNKDKKKEEEYLLEINGFVEKWYDIYGNRTINISYLENGVIPNTYKKDGVNYIKDIGEINGGRDYESYGVNVYDLYVPYSSLERMQLHNGIILFVHGGGFENNTKEETEGLATRFAKLGFITANMEYTNCLDKYKEKSAFRILDEITACIKSIKKELESQGFNGDKLELSLYGISAGAQLSLVYGFSNQNKILPLKYLMNSVGPISLDSNYWYKPTISNITLDNIENCEDVIAAENNHTFTQMDLTLNVKIMNSMYGKKYTQEDLSKLVINNVIQTENEIYKDLYNVVKYGYPVYVIGNNTIPMLCLYGGNDGMIGVAHYCYLKKAYIDNGAEDNITLVYMKHAGHERFHHWVEEDIIAMKKMHYLMVKFGQKYFTQD